MKRLAGGHTAAKGLSLDWDVGRLAPEAEALTTAPPVSESQHWVPLTVADAHSFQQLLQGAVALKG